MIIKILKVPNDKLSKQLFKFPADVFKDFISGGYFNIVEHKKKEIKSRVKLKTIGNTDDKPLDAFDRAILTACQSFYDAGIKRITPNVIYRALTGKTSGNKKPSRRFAAEIMTSVKKLAGTLINVDMSKVCKAFRYNKGKPLVIDFTPILPCHVEKGNINGGVANNIIVLDAISPLVTIARAKRQFVAFDTTCLDSGNSRNTREIIAAKFLVAVRVAESLRKPPKTHLGKKIKPSISFQTLLNNLATIDDSKKSKSAILKNSMDVLKNFKVAKKISGAGFTLGYKKMHTLNWRKTI